MLIAGKQQWSAEEKKILRNNFMIPDAGNLVSLLPGRTVRAIRTQMRRMGLFRFWRSEEDAIIHEHYGKLSPAQIALLLPGRSRRAVMTQANRLGLGGSYQHEVNNSFFSIPSCINSYWAGFIAADGCITPKTRAVTIGLAAKDFDHLARFKDDCGFTGTIRRWVSRSGYKPNAACCGLVVYAADQWLCDLWKNYKIGPRKTKTLEPPDHLDDRTSLAFIAGFIDGDGSVGIRTTTWTGLSLSISVGGRKTVLEWIKFHFDKIAPVRYNLKPATVVPVKPGIDFWHYGVSGSRATAVASRIMDLGLPLMARKWGHARQGTN